MNYYLAEACQNRFILFDCLTVSSLDETFLKKASALLKKENRDDALILVDGQMKEESLFARMMVLGPDGVLGEFCGNGARAVAAYLFQNFSPIKKFFLVTKEGFHLLQRHEPGVYSIQLPKPLFKLNRKFITNHALPKIPSLSYVEVIEPHLVINEKMSDEELFFLGRELNEKKELFPLGINVNAWEIIDRNHLFVKTYERGVQRLTQSCGTGSLACSSLYGKEGSLHVSTPGGLLEIRLRRDGMELKGPGFFQARLR